MKRQVVDIIRTGPGPLARLDCGHETDADAGAAIGDVLECGGCDRGEMPEGFETYKQTPEFTQDTVPAALQRAHSTKRGVWARIVVAEGRLRYQVESTGLDTVLSPGTVGIVIPEVPHAVTPLGTVRFRVYFYRMPASAGEAADAEPLKPPAPP